MPSYMRAADQCVICGQPAWKHGWDLFTDQHYCLTHWYQIARPKALAAAEAARVRLQGKTHD